MLLPKALLPKPGMIGVGNGRFMENRGHWTVQVEVKDTSRSTDSHVTGDRDVQNGMSITMMMSPVVLFAAC